MIRSAIGTVLISLSACATRRDATPPDFQSVTTPSDTVLIKEALIRHYGVTTPEHSITVHRIVADTGWGMLASAHGGTGVRLEKRNGRWTFVKETYAVVF